ncbi:MAG: hypothetical protein COT18_05165 [Elusimicrobia bacterium CG08_land_8_20_14_0_20_59_10]|nr:MAG: hypothetical protein COT18_05165 [Elusimicrobia bacterium CG08_land_8_20_14_0_20_59_10]
MRQPLKPALLLNKAGSKPRRVIKKGGLKRIFKLLDRSGDIRTAKFLAADARKLGPGLLPPGNPLAHCVCFRIIHRPLYPILAFSRRFKNRKPKIQDQGSI